MKENPVFSLKKVCFGYLPGKHLIRDLSVDFYTNESVVILGANGSGKSTLMKLLSGLIHPNGGLIKAFGEDLTEENLQNEEFNSSFRQKVGFIFQNSDAQLFSATVWDEIAFGPLQLGLSSQTVKERVQDTLKLLDIEGLADRPPFRLSGGEKKKVAIAAVLAVNPEVLLLDEPTNGLDPRTQYWLVDFLISLKKAGKTIVIATHDLHIVEDIADRVIIFGEDHSIAADGSPQTLLSNRELLLSVNLIHERSHFHLGGAKAHG